MLRAFFRLLRAAVNAPPRNGRKVGIWAENPADAQPRITPGSLTRNRFYDKRAKNSASLFRFPEFAAIVSQAGGRFYHIIQCPPRVPLLEANHHLGDRGRGLGHRTVRGIPVQVSTGHPPPGERT